MTARYQFAQLPDDVAALVVEGQLRGWANAIADYSEDYRSPNRWTDPSRRRVRAVVWHITDGEETPSLEWLCNPASDASANDVIGRQGRVYNLLPGDDAPWTNGPLCKPDTRFAIPAQAFELGVNPNWWSYTIENVGKSRRGLPGSLTTPQIAALILRTAQAVTHYKLSADAEHILRHASFDSCTRLNCPGFAQSEMAAWIYAVNTVAKAWRGW